MPILRRFELFQVVVTQHGSDLVTAERLVLQERVREPIKIEQMVKANPVPEKLLNRTSVAKIEREAAARRERTREGTLAKYEDGKDAFRPVKFLLRAAETTKVCCIATHNESAALRSYSRTAWVAHLSLGCPAIFSFPHRALQAARDAAAAVPALEQGSSLCGLLCSLAQVLAVSEAMPVGRTLRNLKSALPSADIPLGDKR